MVSEKKRISIKNHVVPKLGNLAHGSVDLSRPDMNHPDPVNEFGVRPTGVIVYI
jgi:hypothetical protein